MLNDPYTMGGPPDECMPQYMCEEFQMMGMGMSCDDSANPDAPDEAEAGQTSGTVPVDGVLTVAGRRDGATNIVGTDIGIGDSIAINTPLSIKIQDTTMEPFEGARTMFLGGALGGCDEHPCELGNSCGYTNYSLSCTPCPLGTVGADGIACLPCAAGKGPNQNQTTCEPCLGTLYSTFGVCQECLPPMYAHGGSNTAETGNTACSDPFRCTGGTYCPSNTSACASQVECLQCAAGQVSTGQDYGAPTACDACDEPGKVANSDQTLCMSCTMGQEPADDRSQCVPCVGLFTSSFGISCGACEEPSVVNPQRTTCSLCPPGQGPNANRTGCNSCTGGEIGSFGVCQDCPGGTQPNPTRTACVPCDDRSARSTRPTDDTYGGT